MAIDFKDSISDPIADDTGNKTMQSMTVSKTIKFGLFTINANAVWGARNQLQKESFPFAFISVPVNRNMFRLQVGDNFKFSYSKYSITDMIMRIMQVEEESLESENIIIHAQQDVFSITNVIEEYSTPEDNAGEIADFDIEPFTNQTVLEAPYILSEDTKIIPLACREKDMDTGFIVYMSIDGGSSYTSLGTSANLQPYGTLNADYGITYTIDDETGFIVDFVDDAELIESVTWPDIFSGAKNMALLGDEIISFKTITPVSGTLYKLENIIRGRFGTTKVTHSIGEDFWFVQKTIGLIADSEIAAGADRKFKLVPYNIRKSGSIADATAIDLSIEGESSKPYIPVNFDAEGESFNPLYTAGNDITLTWSPRYRGKGSGVGIPGTVLADTDREGLFEIEVWVSSVKVRTTTAIDAKTWDYTNAMNVSDNGAAASEITFLLYNYLVDGGITYKSDAVQVICRKE